MEYLQIKKHFFYHIRVARGIVLSKLSLIPKNEHPIASVSELCFVQKKKNRISVVQNEKFKEK